MKNAIFITSKFINGGVFQYSKSFLEALILDKENKTTLFTLEENLIHFENLDIDIKTIKYSKFIIIKHLIKYIFKSKVVLPNYDYLYFPSYSSYILLFKNKFIVTIHDLQEIHFPENFSFIVKLWRKFINKYISKNSFKIICEANHVKNDINNILNTPKSKIHVIQAPPCFKETKNYISKIEEQLPKKYIFYPAQFWKHKNHINLLKAFKNSNFKKNNLHIVLTGRKDKEYHILKKYIDENGLSANILHIPFIEEEDIPIVYEKSIALFMPSYYESISIPIYEAFKYNTLVCCSNFPSLLEQAKNSAIFFDPHITEDIKKCINTITSPSFNRNYFINNGREIIEGLNMNSFGKKISKLIE